MPPDISSAEEGSGPRLRLGDWLRSERLRRGISYAEIERDTRINRLYLEALEDERFEVIPAPVYTRGFLRSYAKALGLNTEDAIAMLPANLPRPAGLEPSSTMRRPKRDAPALSMPQLPSLRVTNISIPTLDPANMRWLLAGTSVAILLLAALFIPHILARHGTRATTGASVGTATVQAGTPASTGAGKMPNLIGSQQAAAQKTLQDAGATWVVVEIASASAPAGTIVGQQPSVGESLKRGDNVTLIVSRGAPQ